MATFGFIGSGLMATEVARLAIGAGFDVVLSNSRGPQSLAPVISALGQRASAVSAGEAMSADVVVLALPLGRLPVLANEDFSGRAVLDLTNYYPHRDGRIPELDSHALTCGQYVQHLLPKAYPVRVFSNISYAHIAGLARPAGAPDRSALPIASDHGEAKGLVAGLVGRLGYDTVDVGPLAESWRFEPNTGAYLFCYAPEGTAAETLQTSTGQPLSAEKLGRLLETAERTDQSAREF